MASGSRTTSSSTRDRVARGVFRWDNGEERRAAVEAVEPEERIVLRFEDDGVVELRLEDSPDGTRVHVRETSPEWSTALGLQALAACAIA